MNIFFCWGVCDHVDPVAVAGLMRMQPSSCRCRHCSIGLLQRCRLTVRAGTPQSTAAVTVCRRAVTPAWCPDMALSPCCLAQRLLPSIMTCINSSSSSSSRRSCHQGLICNCIHGSTRSGVLQTAGGCSKCLCQWTHTGLLLLVPCCRACVHEYPCRSCSAMDR
jgi:hypothetical protein